MVSVTGCEMLLDNNNSVIVESGLTLKISLYWPGKFGTVAAFTTCMVSPCFMGSVVMSSVSNESLSSSTLLADKYPRTKIPVGAVAKPVFFIDTL